MKDNFIGYDINCVLSQQTLNNWGQWYLIGYLSSNIILATMHYKIQNNELWANIKALKKWQYYWKDCKHQVFVLINHNNVGQFMNIKKLELLPG